MDVFSDLMALLFFGLLLWQASFEAIFSFGIDESTFGLIRIPLWPARFILVGGTALLIVQLLFDLIIDLKKVLSGGVQVTAEDALIKEISEAEKYLDDERN